MSESNLSLGSEVNINSGAGEVEAVDSQVTTSRVPRPILSSDQQAAQIRALAEKVKRRAKRRASAARRASDSFHGFTVSGPALTKASGVAVPTIRRSEPEPEIVSQVKTRSARELPRVKTTAPLDPDPQQARREAKATPPPPPMRMEVATEQIAEVKTEGASGGWPWPVGLGSSSFDRSGRYFCVLFRRQ